MKHRVKVSASRTPLTYCYLHNVARQSLIQADKERAGSFYFLMSAGVFAAFAAEAYFNHLGSVTIPYWASLERLSPISKAEVLSHEVLGKPPLWGRRPFQSLKDAFALRDQLAHGRTQTVSYKDRMMFLRTDEEHPEPETPWERLCKPKNVERIVTDVEAIIELFATARDPKARPFSMLSTGSFAKAVATTEEAVAVKTAP